MTKEKREDLLYAVRTKNTHKVKELIEEGVDPNTNDDFRNTVLMHACENGWVDIVKLLIRKGANINEQNLDNATALRKAISNSQPDDKIHEICQILLDNKADPNISERTEYSPLLWSIIYGKDKTTDLLLKSGADPNKKTTVDHLTALIYAAIKGDKNLAEKLINNGADINSQRKSGVTALQLAIENSNIELAEFLLEKGADPNIAAHEFDLCTPLMAAIHGKHYDLAKDLIEKYKADVNITGPNGWTALTYAVATKDDIRFLELVIKQNPIMNVKTNTGMTNLMHAVSCNEIAKIEILLKKGENINAQDNKGETALMKAVKLIDKPEDIVFTLLKHGADLKIKDENGKTALDIFLELERDNEKLVEILTKGYAKIKSENDKKKLSKQILKHRSLRNYVKNSRLKR